jgi:hypothetical protein
VRITGNIKEFQGAKINDKYFIRLPRQHLPFNNGRVRDERHSE